MAYTTDVDVDTLSLYPVITPLVTAGEAHVTTTDVTESPGIFTLRF